MAYAKLVVYLALVASCYCEVINTQKCFLPKSATPTCTVENVRIANCPEAAENKVCKLKGGENATFLFDFTPKFSATALKTKAYKIGSFIDKPFVDMEDDGCKFTTCPTEDGKKQTYSYTLLIKKTYPPGGHQVKWMLWQQENNKNRCCFTFSIQILP